jgi:REP element-mobilizing transposase RayT
VRDSYLASEVGRYKKARWCEIPISHHLTRESVPAIADDATQINADATKDNQPGKDHHPPMPRNEAHDNLPYFCTITVLDWYPIFIEDTYIDPLLESLTFCRQHKQLQLFGYVIMPNHVHLIAAAPNLHEVMRDWKRFTSRNLHDLLKANNRLEILSALSNATEPNRKRAGYLSLWQSGFHPKAVAGQNVFEQKLRYLHENPVRKGLVDHPEDWTYSSARDFNEWGSGVLDLDALVW